MTLPRAMRCLFAAALALASVAAHALTPLPPHWRPPVIVVPPLQQGLPIQLRAVTVRTWVAGDQARSEVEMRLFNPNSRVLEGELQFPLLEGQVVAGFALDVNGQLRAAVPVPKAQGQEIFEDIRRRRVDPGLLERTAGNQYKLRVYPLPANGERHVKITVQETLPLQGGAPLLRLPLAFGARVGSLDVTVSAAGAQVRELVVNGPQGTQTLQDTDAASVHFARTGWEAPRGAAGWLQVALRQPARPQMLLGETGSRRFFAGHVPLRDEPVRRPEPRHIALVWDASGSSAAQSRVLPVLDAYFRALHNPVKVSLIVVRNTAEPVRELTVRPDGFAALAEVLRAQPMDGSSNFDQLPIPADADATVMVTDGLMTDGQRLIGYKHSAPVFAINGSTSADQPRLTRLADRTGGALIDAATLSPQQAVRGMLYHGWRITRLHSLSAERLVAPSLQVRHDRIALAGELVDDRGVVEVALAHPDGRKRTLRVELPRVASAGAWPGQLWAQWRGTELAENPTLHETELKRIAAEHGIPGANSSLIVLEQASDYARYDLPAPPELADEVARLRQTQLATRQSTQQAHLEAIVRQFEERQRWWDRDFPKDAPQRAKPASSQAALGEGQARARAAAAESSERARAQREEAQPRMATPPPAPAAAPAPAEQKSSSDSANGPRPATIALQPWTPDAPYMRRLQDAPPNELYAAYLDERAQHANSSSFFMDVAGLFFARQQTDLALRVLSNLAEMNLENRQLLRLYAYRLVQARRADLAVAVFQRVSMLAPNEPQSWRDLGLALADTGEAQRAVDNLWEVVARPWNGRFAGAAMIALAELNAIAARAQAEGKPVDLARVDARLRRNLPLELRVVMSWDTDDTDIDLWVTDPNGELANYSRRLSYQGGAVSPDATGGYGPEEYALKQAKPGKYVVQAQFYGHQQQVLSAGTTIMVRVTTGFGTAAAKDEWITVRLSQGRETVRLGEIEVR
jgi:Ca-activated chloride channel homolog